ncbi:CHAP domain-containing protein [Paraburkholderia sp. RL18-101-BIB-B]
MMNNRMVSKHRRNFFVTFGLAAIGAVLPSSVYPNSGLTREGQQGDPDLPREFLEFDRETIMGESYSTRGLFEATPPNFGSLLVSEAQLWEGRNRRDNPDSIAALLNLFDLPPALNSRPVPFCAVGVSYVAAMVYAKAVALRASKDGTKADPSKTLHNYLAELEHSHFLPTPSVNDMFLVAQGKHRWVSSADVPRPKAGWLVVYSWKGGAPDHVGIVKSAGADSIETIEFNTSPSHKTTAAEREGGYVASRTRAYPSKFVKGFIRTT